MVKLQCLNKEFWLDKLQKELKKGGEGLKQMES